MIKRRVLINAVFFELTPEICKCTKSNEESTDSETEHKTTCELHDFVFHGISRTYRVIVNGDGVNVAEHDHVGECIAEEASTNCCQMHIRQIQDLKRANPCEERDVRVP